MRVDHDTLPVLSLLTAPTKTRTDSTISCSIELLRGASDGMTITWHSSLMDTSWIMNGANGFNRVSGFDVYYTVGGVDTITVVASGGMIHRGYSINGSEGQYKDQASFKLVVEGDTTITMDQQK